MAPRKGRASVVDHSLESADRLLLGNGQAADPAAAAGIYETLAAGGDGLAHMRLAVLTAAGIGRDQDWGRALDYLRKAAGLGHAGAQGQLGVLGDTDLKTLLAPARTQEAFKSPGIIVIEKLATPAMCDWIVSAGRDRLAPNMVVDTETGRHVPDRIRTGKGAPFPLLITDLVMMAVQERLARTTRLMWRQQEPPFLLSYEPGQRYLPHLDCFDPDEPAFARELSIMGQRVATCLTYLNEEYDGGETDFPRLGWRYRGRKGDALLFLNVGPDWRPDPMTLHAGLAPTRGRKWLLSQWVRDRELPLQ